VSGWARRWHLDVEWIRAGARETVIRWHRYPDMRKDLGVEAFLPSVADAIGMAGFPGGWSTEIVSDAGEVVTAKVPNLYLEFKYPIWDPRFENAPEWLVAFEKHCSTEGRAHIRAMRQWLQGQGLRKATLYSLKHLEWLVLWQCAGSSLGKIREQYPEDQKIHRDAARTTISKGIRRAAELIELPVRPKETKPPKTQSRR
jgi:hypothetical protein